jgi:hypothetical protein
MLEAWGSSHFLKVKCKAASQGKSQEAFGSLALRQTQTGSPLLWARGTRAVADLSLRIGRQHRPPGPTTSVAAACRMATSVPSSSLLSTGPRNAVAFTFRMAISRNLLVFQDPRLAEYMRHDNAVTKSAAAEVTVGRLPEQNLVGNANRDLTQWA